jgi:hydrogenase maturation protein HypF
MTGAAIRAAEQTRERVRITVRGIVQGVGFRPFVHGRAKALGLAGWVMNTPDGVTVEAEGTADAVAALVRAIHETPPPNAVVGNVGLSAVATTGEGSFEIRASLAMGARGAEILPDLGTCEVCLAEIRDSGNRRYRYPFTNCTHCGPRYSIITDLPYDRARTSMLAFPMCADCRDEYEDTSDRRFHAEPIACAACGPQLALWDAAGNVPATHDRALRAAGDALARGAIVAIKGLGGFHLMVDARNQTAVERLRLRKHREAKPFAVMFPTLDSIRAAADVSAQEAALLAGRERPIVLVRRRGDALADAVAPRNPRVGALLPYTPLHHLLLADIGFPVVATSGNRSDEPIVIDEGEALERLAGIADLFLVHDRPIVRPVDDSVVRVVAGKPQIVRRARGYAPAAIAADLPPGVLALGGHLKAAIALTTRSGALLSPHIGDLDTAEARDAYDHAIRDIARLHDVAPSLVVHDLHPDYHSTRAAEGLGVARFGVQHHVAHVAACMTEHALSPPLLGVAWDGTGFGSDGTIWGGEFLRIGSDGWTRVGHLRPFPLPGGEAAVREPRRSALGLLFALFGYDALAMTHLAPMAAFTAGECETLATMMERSINSPITSSAGRLFDGVAALVGLRQSTSYEGEAAAELEWAAGDEMPSRAYEFALNQREEPIVIDWEPAIHAILVDVGVGRPAAAISASFHAGLALAIAEVAARIGEKTVVLSGGCFQNARLTETTIAALRARGLSPWWHERVPPNDGGLALGQAYWAAKMTGGL